jgi:hypothetical protein
VLCSLWRLPVALNELPRPFGLSIASGIPWRACPTGARSGSSTAPSTATALRGCLTQHQSYQQGDLVFALDTPQPDSGESSDSLWFRAFREVLEFEDLDEDTDFFQAGGHSLLIPRLLSYYESLSGWRPQASLIFKFSSPRQLEAESAVLRESAGGKGST